MNLWTVGCADPRLTAPARSPMDKPGKRHAFPPPCPPLGGCPQASQHPQQDRLNLISGKDQTTSRLPAFSLFLPEPVQTPGTVALDRSFHWSRERWRRPVG